jgi:surface carbohydrate biosynthesis protein
MMAAKPTLLIPVENQVRELDPKLLLACVAARRGFSAVMGSRREMHFHVTSFPKSIYLSKSMTVHSDLMFKIMRKLGHEIVAWDEEALVHLPAETYYSRRLSPVAMGLVSHMFAWGQENAELWRQYPQLPPGTAIHITGNPRSDMLRPEIRPYYQMTVEELLRIYGNFILINTNFNHVNAFSPVQNLFQPVKNPGSQPKFGRAARGMTLEYAEGFRDHKQAIFEGFQRLVPKLARAFPDYTIVVRPHPTENQEVYHQIAARCERVQVTNEGNVVPWLMATKAVIHNGCTTGEEAYVMGVPAISYRVPVNEFYDYGFYRLPNLLSHECFDFEELQTTLKRVLEGEFGPAAGDEREKLIDYHLASRQGPLACEQIIDILEQMSDGRSREPLPSLRNRIEARSIATIRRLIKRSKAYLPDSHNRPEFQRHRYPEVSLEEMRARMTRFQMLLGDTEELKIEQISRQFFRISG